MIAALLASSVFALSSQNYISLAKREAKVEQTLSASAFCKFADSVELITGVTVALAFYFDDQRKLNVDGTATTKARMICFRCNQPIMLDLVSEISSILVFSEEDAVEATKMGDHHRKGLVVVSKNEPDMVEIVEDELLLSLPQSIEQLELLGHRCEFRENASQGEAGLKERQFPFAGLRDKIEASKE